MVDSQKKQEILNEIKKKLIDLKHYYPDSNIKLSASCALSAKTARDVKVEITEHFTN